MDKTCRIWDRLSGACLRILKGHKKWVKTVNFTIDGKDLISCSLDRRIVLWDLARAPDDEAKEESTDSAEEPNGEKGKEERFRAMKEVKSIKRSGKGGAKGEGRDGQTGTTSDDDEVTTQGTANGVTIQAHDDFILCSAVARPTLLATSSRDRTVKLWDYQVRIGR